MYLGHGVIGFFALSLSSTQVTSFTPQQHFILATRTTITKHYESTLVEDCGCATTTPTQFSGKPSEKAKSINVREAIRETPFYSVNGERTQMDDVVFGNGQQASVVVFLRSLG